MNFNRLTDSEDERLTLLAEECAEVIQAVMKIQRHGYESFDPTEKVSEDQHPTTNRHMLEKELGDVGHAIDRMRFSRDINYARVLDHEIAKASKVERYLHYQHATGYLKAQTPTKASPSPGAQEKTK